MNALGTLTACRLSLTEKVTFATLNVFGRNLNGIPRSPTRTGRDHFGNHAVIGDDRQERRSRRSSAASTADDERRATRRATSTRPRAPQVTAAATSRSTKSQVAAARTLGAALGIPDSVAASDYTAGAGGKVVTGALGEPAVVVKGRASAQKAGGLAASGAPEPVDCAGMGRWSSLVATLALSACATAPAVTPKVMPSATSAEPVEPPANAAAYTTAARPDGVVGGPRAAALANEVREALRARGDAGEPDGALAVAARWLAGQGAGARQRGLADVALRAGFPGAVSTAAAFRLDAGADDVWRQALADVAGNLAVTRYAVYVSPAEIAVVVFGRMEATLEPIQRRFRPGEACRLRGEISPRYDHARIYLTRPDGKVDETPKSGRAIDVSLPLSAPGVYRVEVMSDGATGPVVLANVPLYVGVAEPAWTPSPPRDDVGGASPAQAEARMLALLNDARRAAGLPSLVVDLELQAVATAHTEDMSAHRFFGHVSPTTGMVEDRLKRAGIIVSLCGENVAQADNADGAHQILMESPAHRANMLGVKFTHVGIGIAVRPGEAGDLLATLVFARRPRPPSAPLTPALATNFISSLRRAKGAAGAIAVDPVLQKAAEAGIAFLTANDAATPD